MSRRLPFPWWFEPGSSLLCVDNRSRELRKSVGPFLPLLLAGMLTSLGLEEPTVTCVPQPMSDDPDPPVLSPCTTLPTAGLEYDKSAYC